MSRLVLRRCLLGPLLLLSLPATASSERQEWRFSVLLDDKPIGEQRFTITADGAEREVEIVADLAVEFLFVTAYRYRHRNKETWRGGCLDRIRAETDDNGDNYFVSGQRSDDGFRLETHAGNDTIEGCVRSFAYWDPAILDSRRLLNSQTGELEAVRLVERGPERIEVRGEGIEARRYTLLGEQLEIDLWYTPQGDWLALESVTESGARLRYAMQ